MPTTEPRTDPANGCRRSRWRAFVTRHGPVLLALVVGVSLNWTGYRAVQHLAENEVKTEFRLVSEEYAIAVRRSMDEHLDILVSLLAFYDASKHVDREEFKTFTAPLLQRHPGIQALEWVPRVTHAERASYVQRARADGISDFELMERADDGTFVVAGRRPEYFPVYYVQPRDGNETALGFDLASNERRLAALNRAGATGRLTATERIRLVQDTTGHYGVLIVAATYPGAERPPSEVRDPRGFVVAVLRLGDVLAGASMGLSAKCVRVTLTDETAPEGERFLTSYVTSINAAETSASDVRGLDALLHYKTSFDVGGRMWTLDSHATPGHTASVMSTLPPFVLFAGLAFTALLALYIRTLVERHDRVKSMVTKRTSQLRRKTAESEQQSQILESILKSLGDGVVVADRDMNFLVFNPAAERMMGLGASDISSDSWSEHYGIFDPSTGREFDPDRLPLVRAVAGEHVDEVELFIRNHNVPDGVTLSVTGRPVLYKNDELMGGVVVFRDISDRLRAERELGARNEELARVNAELEQFSYIASHDLQEPLRKITAFSGMLHRDLGTDLPERAAKDLGYITDAAGRMQTLVQDLLALSRTGRSEMNPVDMPLDECIDGALDNLTIRIEESGAVIERDPMPEIRGDKTLLTQLYQNLISNALKFSNGAKPRIHLTCESREGWTVFGVRDNGIGMKADYLEQIFSPFKRLHSRGAYEGTGIGLAICRKTVERHGGRIWVSSQEGKGSHFMFTLTEEAEVTACQTTGAST